MDGTEDVALNFGDEDELFSRKKKFRFANKQSQSRLAKLHMH